jgi:hypothetical protein
MVVVLHRRDGRPAILTAYALENRQPRPLKRSTTGASGSSESLKVAAAEAAGSGEAKSRRQAGHVARQGLTWRGGKSSSRSTAWASATLDALQRKLETARHAVFEHGESELAGSSPEASAALGGRTAHRVPAASEPRRLEARASQGLRRFSGRESPASRRTAAPARGATDSATTRRFPAAGRSSGVGSCRKSGQNGGIRSRAVSESRAQGEPRRRSLSRKAAARGRNPRSRARCGGAARGLHLGASASEGTQRERQHEASDRPDRSRSRLEMILYDRDFRDLPRPQRHRQADLALGEDEGVAEKLQGMFPEEDPARIQRDVAARARAARPDRPRRAVATPSAAASVSPPVATG